MILSTSRFIQTQTLKKETNKIKNKFIKIEIFKIFFYLIMYISQRHFKIVLMFLFKKGIGERNGQVIYRNDEK